MHFLGHHTFKTIARHWAGMRDILPWQQNGRIDLIIIEEVFFYILY